MILDDAANLRLVVATPDLLRAATSGPDPLGAALGVAIPAGWPEFPEGLTYVQDVLETRPAEADWWTYFFLDADAGLDVGPHGTGPERGTGTGTTTTAEGRAGGGTLVGSGGFKGPPADGVAEIGYEIAPALRGRGYATAFAGLLVERARALAPVSAVDAHTLAQENASTAVLRKSGFALLGTVTDPDDGDLWHWRRQVPISRDVHR